MPEDDLSESAVYSALATNWIGRPYHFLTETGSTNDLLKSRVADGTKNDPPAGTVLLTDYQTAGRGRLGRRWGAPPGSSLLFSTLLRPNWSVERAGWLTMIAGLALAESIEAIAGISVGLKWPNDLVIMHDSQWCKVGGLLVDAQIDDDRLVWAIVGAGINVNIAVADLPETVPPATSLMHLAGRPLPRRPLLLDILLRLEQHYEAADRGRSPRAEWQARLITLDQHVIVSDIQGSLAIEGVAEATDEWGRLLVRDDSGRLQTIAAGDVTLRIPNKVAREKDDQF